MPLDQDRSTRRKNGDHITSCKKMLLNDFIVPPKVKKKKKKKKKKEKEKAFREAICIFYENARFFMWFYLMEVKQYI